MSKNRIEAFTDAVIAIVMTLLVLELHQPKNDTFQAFLGIEHQFIIYLISFVMLAIYWNNHHRESQNNPTIRKLFQRYQKLTFTLFVNIVALLLGWLIHPLFVISLDSLVLLLWVIPEKKAERYLNQ